MKISGMDHIVLSVRDVDQSLGFYCDLLGLKPERVEQFRAGDIGFPSVRINESTIIDLLPAGQDSQQSGRNLDHFCLVSDQTDLAQLAGQLEAQGVTVTQQPISRWGAQGQATSIYILDPAGNEVEIRCY